MADPLSLRLLRYLPRNLISRAFGRAAAIERPRWLASWMKRAFATHFGIDFDEAERSIDAYPSLLTMFTRRLRAGARPIDLDPSVLVSPVDARIGAFGRIESGRLVQAKGLDYEAASLLGSPEEAARFDGGLFLTLYLSPRDYHRIHAPDTGRISRTLYEPGTLWPVNPPAVCRIPRLFAVNERVTSLIETDAGPIAVCMVGATNVGSIRLSYADLVTNRGNDRLAVAHRPAIEVSRGGDLGCFELGSTVVLMVAGTRCALLPIVEPDAWIAMGTAILRRD